MTARWAVRFATGPSPQARTTPLASTKTKNTACAVFFCFDENKRIGESNVGAVLNDSPVGCQIRDRTEPAGENDSPRFYKKR